MFFFQSQEMVRNQRCTVRRFCDSPGEMAALQDLLIYICRGISVYAENLKIVDKKVSRYVCQAILATIINVTSEDGCIFMKIEEGIKIRKKVKMKAASAISGELPDCATWTPKNREEIAAKAMSSEVRISTASNDETNSLRSLIIFGVKGIAAHAENAAILGYEKDEIYDFIFKALASTTRDQSLNAMISLIMKAGEMTVNAMALLDEANSSVYCKPKLKKSKLMFDKTPVFSSLAAV